MPPNELSKWADVILEIQARVGQIDGRIMGIERNTEKLSAHVEKLTEAVLSKMTPDHCAHLHLELEKRLHKQIAESCTQVESAVTGRAGLVARVVRDVLIVVAALGGFSGLAAALGLLR